LENFDNTKLERVELQDKDTLLLVWDLHHKDVVSMSNLGMTPETVFHSLVRFEALKTWSCVTP